MPTTVFVRFDSPGEVPASPSRLHAALATVLDLPRGISPGRASSFPTLAHRPHHERPGAKPYCLGELTTGPGTFGMEVRFLDDRLVETFDAWLAWGGVLRVGGARESATLIAFEGQVVAETTWQDLVEQSEDTTWEVRLVTPTVFSSKGAHVRGIPPVSLATSLQERWHQWDPDTAPPRIDRAAMAQVLTTQDFTTEARVSLGMPRGDRRGRLASRAITAYEGALRISGVEGAPQTADFSRLMALSAYTNVGSHAGYGMGVIDAVAVG